ncbi:MAG TPA: hypothetical protein VE619_06425 [Nitrososphaeraceae archaeon]|nr:hypothetical protein [Nitrososphaeraceae archaeon]
MPTDLVANFDSFIWVAVGLFIAGLFTIMVYGRSSSKEKQYPRQQGTSSDIE